MTQFCIVLSCILLISNSMISRAILEKTRTCGFLKVFKKLTRACFTQIALEIIPLPLRSGLPLWLKSTLKIISLLISDGTNVSSKGFLIPGYFSPKDRCLMWWVKLNCRKRNNTNLLHWPPTLARVTTSDHIWDFSGVTKRGEICHLVCSQHISFVNFK